MYAVCLNFLHLSDFISSTTFAALLIVEFRLAWIFFLWFLTVFTNLSSLYFLFNYSAILVISAFYVASIITRLSLLLYVLYAVFVSFWVRILYIAGIFSMFLSKFYIYSSLQSIIQKLNLNIRTANAAFAVILFLIISSGFSVILKIPAYSFCKISFITTTTTTTTTTTILCLWFRAS